jgi:2-(1,2-epoxy-1,2-dihydrophenyl)acetyl-CoA isomerase
MNGLVLHEREGPVALLSLNRPDRHNALVPELLEELLEAIAAAAIDPGVRAVVLAAEGPSFSTGGDVRAFFDEGDDVAGYAAHIVGLLNDTMLALIDTPKPIVAAVHGMVTGGSLGLVLAADVVLVADEASFTPWYGVLGFSPDGGWTAILPDIIGRGRAADILLRNRTITAKEAVRWGLAAAVTPAIGIREEAVALAGEIADKVPGSVRNTKARLWARREEIARGLEDERTRFVQQIITDEARRGMAAFLRED